jgi:prevent-host-death family protein
MNETITTLDIRKRLGEILDRVALRHDEFVIERRGRPLAALVPVERIRHIENFARLRLRDGLVARGTSPSQREADALADEAKHRGRRKR